MLAVDGRQQPGPLVRANVVVQYCIVQQRVEAYDMVHMTRTFQAPRPSQVVRGYLQDFSRAEEWCPGAVSCQREDSGPAKVGSRWTKVSKILGITIELTYELLRLDDDRLVFRGRNKAATVTQDIGLGPGTEPGTTAVTYNASINFHSAAKLAGPAARVALERIGDQTVIAMTEALDRLPRH